MAAETLGDESVTICCNVVLQASPQDPFGNKIGQNNYSPNFFALMHAVVEKDSNFFSEMEPGHFTSTSIGNCSVGSSAIFFSLHLKHYSGYTLWRAYASAAPGGDGIAAHGADQWATARCFSRDSGRARRRCCVARGDGERTETGERNGETALRGQRAGLFTGPHCVNR